MIKQKLLLIGWTLLISTHCTFSQKVILLHHSTGGNVFKQGNVLALIDCRIGRAGYPAFPS
jgi:hypothetical protein